MKPLLNKKKNKSKKRKRGCHFCPHFLFLNLKFDAF